MVNPSRSCEPCRIKRRRCDLKVPGCSQCVRARISCPGYPDTFDLRLRDVTQSTARKAQAKASKARRQEAETYPSSTNLSTHYREKVGSKIASDAGVINDGQDDGSDISEEHNELVVPAPVSYAELPDQAALSYFMHTYATHSSFNYLPNFYSTLVDQIQSVNLSSLPTAKLDMKVVISIPALVLLSQELKQPSMLSTAHLRYANALAATQDALSDPQRATLDTTLMSVLLLGLVEALQFRGRRDPGAWDAHVSGAEVLLRMRGTEQLNSDLGRKMYFQASANIKRRCALRSIRVPAWLTRLHQRTMELVKDGEIMDVGISIFLHASLLLENFSALRADVAEDIISAQDCFRRAVDLGDEVDSLLSDLQNFSPYGVISDASSFQSHAARAPAVDLTVPGNKFHTYSSPRIARWWNDFRMMRLYISEIIYESFRAIATTNDDDLSSHPLPSTTLLETWQAFVAQAMRVAEEATVGILQSVPYMLHLSDAPKLTGPSLVLPLSSIALSEVPPLGIRSLARDRLREMCDRLAIPQAAEALQVVDDSMGLEKWATISHGL